MRAFPHRLFWAVALGAAVTGPWSGGALAADKDKAVPDVLGTPNLHEGGPGFNGVTFDGLSGLVIMPTAAHMQEGQHRFTIVSYTVLDKSLNIPQLNLGINPAPGPVKFRQVVVQPVATVRAGNKTELAIGKQFENNDIEDNTVPFNSVDNTDSQFFAFKHTFPVSRRKSWFLTAAGSNRTSRDVILNDKVSTVERTGFLTFSQVGDRYEVAASWRSAKVDGRLNGQPFGTNKSHQWGLGVEYLMSDDMSLNGELWTKPKEAPSGEDAEYAVGLRYTLSERLQLQGGVTNFIGTDTEAYGGISYLTKFSAPKKAEAPKKK